MGLVTTGEEETEESPEDTLKPFDDPERPHPTSDGGHEDQPQTPGDSGQTHEEAIKHREKAPAESRSGPSPSVGGGRGGACGYDEPKSSSGERRQLIPDSDQHRQETISGAEPAAPEEADEDILLAQTVDSLLRKCGNNVDVLLDAILDQTTDEFHPASMYVRNALEDQNGTNGALEVRPLLQLLQNCFRSFQCTKCSPLGRLAIQSISTSGSVMEGLCNRSAALVNDSDVDTMYEFGPIQIEPVATLEQRESDTTPPPDHRPSATATPEPDEQPPSAAPQPTSDERPPSAAPQPTSAAPQPTSNEQPPSAAPQPPSNEQPPSAAFQPTSDEQPPSAAPQPTSEAPQPTSDERPPSAAPQPTSEAPQPTSDEQPPSAAPQPTSDEQLPSTAPQPTSDEQPPSAASQPPPRLTLTPTDIPGFVHLLQPRTPDCRHEVALPFSAHTFHRLMHASVRFEMGERSVALGSSGPSTEFHWSCTVFDGNDAVPCFRTHWWPSEEFLNRPRTQDWPPAAARADIVRYGVHLVVKSAPGGAPDPNQWRISFSRAEVVVSWHLTTKQRGSLLALKKCKKGLGERGKAVKSYFMKTSLLWLCQEIPSGEWNSAKEGTQHILDFLESAVEARNLSCFFWTKINLFRFLSAQDMDAMKETIRLLRTEMNRQLMRWCVRSLPHFVKRVLRHPAQVISERQLRVCMARSLVVYAVKHATRKPWNSQQLRLYSTHWTPRLLGSSAALELEAMHHMALGTTFLQKSLFRALLVAPMEVLSATRLTRTPDGLFTLDPMPLFSLLEGEDGVKLLVQPERVLAWCHRQHELAPIERPPGVPKDINQLRGFCDLVLRPALLQRALCESVAGYQTRWHEEELDKQRTWRDIVHIADLLVVPDLKEFEQRLRIKYDGSVERRMQRALGVAGGFARGVASMWWEELTRLFNDPVVAAAFQRKYRSLPDTWQLRQYVFSGPETSAATAPPP